MGCLVVPLNYAIVAPGGLTNLETSFEIEGYEMDDHFYSIHVYTQDPITVFQYLMFKNNDNYEISRITKRQEDTSYIDSFNQGNISKEASYKTAIVKAYEMASSRDDSISINYTFKGLTIYDFPRRIEELHIGDKIVAINSQSLVNLNFEDAEDLAYKRDVIYTIKREDGKTFDYHYTYDAEDVLFWFFPNYEITDANPAYNYDSISLIGGSSGGLMQTLSIYSSLLKLNIDDLKIAGTGTIEMTGKVGRIGGIREKIITAKRERVNIFFIPEYHLNDIKGMEYDYTLVPVSNIEEAVEWLYENVVK